MTAPNTGQDPLLRQASDRFGQDKLAADAIGVSPSRFSRLLNLDPKAGRLGVKNCFRLAAILGLPPQQVLRANEKADLADAMDEYIASTTNGQVPPKRGSNRATAVVTPEVGLALDHPHVATRPLDDSPEARIRTIAEQLLELAIDVGKARTARTAGPRRARDRRARH